MRYSVSFKILALFTLLSCLAMFSMFSSVYMANSSDGDAAAINLAGSLRMQAWRLASSPAHISENLSEHYVQQLEEDLHSPLLLAVVTQKNTVHQQYQIVLQKWHKLKELHEINHFEYVLQADDFVAFVDDMVGLIEVQSQAKIDALRQLQYSTILVTLLSILSALFIIRQRIIKPLNGLVAHSKALLLGDFSQRVAVTSNDEFNLLASSVNQMTDKLALLYANLESQVVEKTSQLEQKNQRLELLLRSAKMLTNEPDEVLQTLPQMISEFEKGAEIGRIQLCITTEFHPLMIAKTDLTPHLTPCERGMLDRENCRSCQEQKQSYHQPLQSHDTKYGHIQVFGRLDNEQKRLLRVLSDLIANSLHLKHFSESKARLVLMEERTLIARELHDSLAQALTTQKFNLARLSKSIEKSMPQPILLQISHEAQEGLSVAYTQLRELISSFRLSFNYSGLQAALQSTIAEYQLLQITDFELHFAAPVTLSAEEEMHCLYICREALNNVLKHANASHCRIDVLLNDQEITVSIKDNGRGIKHDHDETKHFGLNILKERAAKLAGELVIASDESGSLIQVQFTPSCFARL